MTGTTNSDQIRLVVSPADAQALLNLIAHLSRRTACIATNLMLGRELGWSERTVSRYLLMLAKRKLIIRRRVPWRQYARGGEPRRVIYLVAHRDDEVGALQVANLLRRRRGAVRSDDEFCGRLQCAPRQFGRWLKLAVERQWLTVIPSDDGRRVFKVAMRVPTTKLPPTFSKRAIVEGQPKTVFALGAPPTDPVRQALIEILDGLLKHKVAVTMTDDELRRHPSMPPKTSRSTVQQKLRQLVSEGRYFRYPLPKGYGRGRLICTKATNSGSLVNYAALLRPDRVQPPRTTRGRPRTAAPRLRVGEVQRRLVELSVGTGRSADRFKVTSAEITTALTALGLTGPHDRVDALERVALHLLEAREPSQPPVLGPSTLSFDLIDPFTDARTVVGDGKATSNEPTTSEDTAIPNQVEETEVSGVTADGKIWFIDPVSGAKTIPG